MSRKRKEYIINPKVNEIYYVSNADLKIKNSKGAAIPGGHNVIVTSVDTKRKTCRVKTITSLEHKTTDGYRYDFQALNQAKAGKILPIPIKELNSKHYSGITQNPITIKISNLNKSRIGMKYPKKYDKLIHKK